MAIDLVSEGIDKLLAQSAGVRVVVPEAKMDDLVRKALGGFVQIGGDFGDPWTYGGTWYSKEQDQLVHFDGLEGEGAKDVEAEDQRVDSLLTPDDYTQIVKAVTAQNDEAWEDEESGQRLPHADTVNANRAFPVYRTGGERDEVIEKDWADNIADIKAEFGDKGEETWAGLAPEHKLEMIASHIGWYEFDSYPDKYTKAELSKYLGIDL